MPVSVYVEVRGQLKVSFLKFHPPFFLGQGLWWAPEIGPSQPPAAIKITSIKHHLGFVLFVWDGVILCSPCWPEISCTDQADLKLRDPPAFLLPPHQVLGLKACATLSGCASLFTCTLGNLSHDHMLALKVYTDWALSSDQNTLLITQSVHQC